MRAPRCPCSCRPWKRCASSPENDQDRVGNSGSAPVQLPPYTGRHPALYRRIGSSATHPPPRGCTPTTGATPPSSTDPSHRPHSVRPVAAPRFHQLVEPAVPLLVPLFSAAFVDFPDLPPLPPRSIAFFAAIRHVAFHCGRSSLRERQRTTSSPAR